MKSFELNLLVMATIGMPKVSRISWTSMQYFQLNVRSSIISCKNLRKIVHRNEYIDSESTIIRRYYLGFDRCLL